MSAYVQPTHLFFGIIKGTGNIFHRIKNRVHKCCVGGYMAILICGSFYKYGVFFPKQRRFSKTTAVFQNYGSYPKIRRLSKKTSDNIPCDGKMFCCVTAGVFSPTSKGVLSEVDSVNSVIVVSGSTVPSTSSGCTKNSSGK